MYKISLRKNLVLLVLSKSFIHKLHGCTENDLLGINRLGVMLFKGDLSLLYISLSFVSQSPIIQKDGRQLGKLRGAGNSRKQVGSTYIKVMHLPWCTSINTLLLATVIYLVDIFGTYVVVRRLFHSKKNLRTFYMTKFNDW